MYTTTRQIKITTEIICAYSEEIEHVIKLYESDVYSFSDALQTIKIKTNSTLQVLDALNETDTICFAYYELSRKWILYICEDAKDKLYNAKGE